MQLLLEITILRLELGDSALPLGLMGA